MGPVLHRYDSDGNEVWKRQSAGAASVVADATGVYVAGHTNGLPGQCRLGSGFDSFVRKYDAEGVEQWTREFGASDASVAVGVAVDSSGVYVASQSGLTGFEDFDFHLGTRDESQICSSAPLVGCSRPSRWRNRPARFPQPVA
jgi:outer membrane protein assembly factor BamB